MSEPISLKNQGMASQLPTTWILTVDAGHTPEPNGFFRSFERVKPRGWPTFIMESDHDVQWSKPKELVQSLEATAGFCAG